MSAALRHSLSNSSIFNPGLPSSIVLLCGAMTVAAQRKGSTAGEPDSVEAIAAEAKVIDSLRMKWRTFDKKAALALRRRIKDLNDRIEQLRKRIDPEGDPDHDQLHEIQEPLGDAAEDVRRALRALKLAAEASSIADETFLDWLQSCAREGLPLDGLWERTTHFFGKSQGRAERIFAMDGYHYLPDQSQHVLLLESAADQGDSIAAASLIQWQPQRRGHWLARALELAIKRHA